MEYVMVINLNLASIHTFVKHKKCFAFNKSRNMHALLRKH